MASRLQSKEANEELIRAMRISESGGASTRSWEHIDACIQTTIRNCWLLRAFVSITDPQGNQIRYPDVVVRFYNETVGFIMGEPRTIRTETWEGLLDASLPKSNEPQKVIGNIGSQIISAYFGSTNETKPALVRVSGDKIDRRLLSLSESDIIYMWIMRQNGLDDMVRVMPILSGVYMTLTTSI